MSEVKIVIRDLEEDRSGTVHGSVAEWFVAALSADPVSISELNAAIDRFALESPNQGHMAHFRTGLDDEPWDAGLVVIDLAARLVVIDSTYSHPGPTGTVLRHGIKADSPVPLNYVLSNDWLFLKDRFSWEGTAATRRQEFASQTNVDLREILYGEPMLRFIANGCLSQSARRNEIADQVRQEWVAGERERSKLWANDDDDLEPKPDPQMLSMRELAGLDEEDPEDIEHFVYLQTIRDIHADWLMTPCPELNGEIPRTAMLRDHERLSTDMSDREDQWRLMGQRPPGISPESHAFRFGGFNTTEFVMYYDFVREIAWSCWDQIQTIPENQRKAWVNGKSDREAFLRDEVIRLQAVGKRWLDAPWADHPAESPHSFIGMERRRLPNGGKSQLVDSDNSGGDHSDVDHSDEEQGFDLSNIGFLDTEAFNFDSLKIDGGNMDNMFAFAYQHKTVESWEQEQADNLEHNELIEMQWEISNQLSLPPEYGKPPANFSRTWHRVVEMPDGEIPIGYRLLKMGHQLARVIAKLRMASKHDTGFQTDEHIESLRIAWGLLRTGCDSPTSTTQPLDLEANVSQFVTVLNKLADDLESHCEDLLSSATSNKETGSSGIRAPDARWQNAILDTKKLHQKLTNFCEPSQESPDGGWYADDYPF